MEPVSVMNAIDGWSHEDLANLWSLLGGEGEVPSATLVEERMKWLYHLKVVADSETAVRNGLGWVRSTIQKSEQQSTSSDAIRELPSYDELVAQACKHMKAFDATATLEESELFLAQATIISALQGMTPRQRAEVFQQTVDVDEIASAARVPGRNLYGPATTFAALGVAQASGFGVYLASTTALGFLTHAVGVTLPFVAYTGMTSTIAFLLGPAGWMAAGAWAGWRLSEPKWKKLVPALVYIALVNSRREGQPAG